MRRRSARSACARRQERPPDSRSQRSAALTDEVQAHGPLVRARLLGPAQELCDRLPTLVAVIAGQLVDVHVDEAVSVGAFEVACEVERVGDRLLTMIEGYCDRFAQDGRQLVQARNVAARDVDAEWKRQPGLQ